MGHKVKTHYWNRGVLDTIELWFDSLEAAIGFTEANGNRHHKIYDENQDLVYAVTNGQAESYAAGSYA